MTETQTKLWEAIRSFPIDDPDSQYKFSHRLAHENLWSLEYTHRVIHEYKIFMFLGCVLPHPVTPSVPIDQCWHLHMIYSRSYEEFCEVMDRKFHHGPTKGGKQEEAKYEDQYLNTFVARNTHFDPSESYDIWCLPADRWTPCDLRFIDLTRHWVIPTGDTKAVIKVLLTEIKSNIRWLLGS